MCRRMSPPPSNVVMSRVCELQGMKASCLIRDRVRRIGGGRKEERGGGFMVIKRGHQSVKD